MRTIKKCWPRVSFRKHIFSRRTDKPSLKMSCSTMSAAVLILGPLGKQILRVSLIVVVAAVAIGSFVVDGIIAHDTPDVGAVLVRWFMAYREPIHLAHPRSIITQVGFALKLCCASSARQDPRICDQTLLFP